MREEKESDYSTNENLFISIWVPSYFHMGYDENLFISIWVPSYFHMGYVPFIYD